MRKCKRSNPNTRTLFGEKVTPAAEKQENTHSSRRFEKPMTTLSNKYKRRSWTRNG